MIFWSTNFNFKVGWKITLAFWIQAMQIYAIFLKFIDSTNREVFSLIQAASSDVS